MNPFFDDIFMFAAREVVGQSRMVGDVPFSVTLWQNYHSARSRPFNPYSADERQFSASD
jgi:hypothetical protein